MKYLSIVTLSLTGILLSAQLPEYKPPFQSRILERIIPEFHEEGFLSNGKNYIQPYLSCGNKKIGLRRLDGRFRTDRDFIPAIHVDGRELLHIRFWGEGGKENFGWPFADIPGKPGGIKTDAKAKSITYFKPYRLPNGKEAVFLFVLRPDGAGKAELEWNPGISDAEIATLKNYTLSPWMEFPTISDYRTVGIRFDSIPFTPASDEKFKQDGNRWNALSWSGKIQKIELENSISGKRIELRMPDSMPAKLREIFIIRKDGTRQYHAVLQLSMNPGNSNRKIKIDFGMGSAVRKTPPPVGGIDFWKHDAIHVPVRPTKNLISNPSFNQGLRYYRWIHGGAWYTPSEQPRYSIDPRQGRGGGNALLIRPVQNRAAAVVTFPLPLKKGTLYTMSCYAKKTDAKNAVLIFTPFSHSGKQFLHDFAGKNRKQTSHPLSSEWRRYSYTFRYDHGGIGLLLNALAESSVLVDDLQLEEGEAATEFADAVLDGNLRTSDPDNLLNAGTPLNAEFHVFGTKGKLRLTLFDYYRRELWKQEYQVRGGDRIALPFDTLRPGTGNFVVRADFQPENAPEHTDYYRFCVMKFLENKHATKNLFGTEMRTIGRISRANDLGRLFMVSGIGATVYGRINGPDESVLKRWKIENLLSMMGNHSGKDPKIADFVKYQKNEFRALEKATPEALKRIEEAAYACAKDAPEAKTWALTGEIDKAQAMLRANRYDEYAKLLDAFRRGIKRANPDARLFPDAGTQSYSKIWGREETESKIRATAGKIKWDGFATHPYGSIDGTAAGPGDFDEDVCAHFIAMLRKYGYDKTPIYFIEAFNLISAYVPEWDALWWGDGWQGGRPGYDWGLREYNQAAWIARGYLIALKYWPKVQHWNFWQYAPFHDQHLTPFAMLNAINTLGNLFGNPKFVADIRPAPGIRAYVFRNEKGEGIAGIWYISNAVESGLIAGPELKIPSMEKPEVIDLMGNLRSFEMKNNSLHLPLNAAPVFVRMKSPEKLVNALKKAEATGGEVSVNFNVNPDQDGGLKADILNLSGKTLEGSLQMENLAIPFTISGNRSVEKNLPSSKENSTGTMYSFRKLLTAVLKDGSRLEKMWKMNYFYVPYTASAPDWSRIPAIPIPNRFLANGGKFSGKNDLSASFKTAWNEKKFYLRVEVSDDHILSDPDRFKKSGFEAELYRFDGCLEVYFDCAANGLSNNREGYDDDDYRYDFAPGNPKAESGPGLVWRRTAAHMQLAGGLDMPSREKANRSVLCHFTRIPGGYIYEIVFEQPYLEPFPLKAGASAGFALFLHDRDSFQDKPGSKGLSLSTESGSHVDHRPHLWPRMILKQAQ